MPYTIGPDGSLVFVQDTPDRAAPKGDGSTIVASLENQAAGERKIQIVDQGGNVLDVGESGVDTALASGRYRLASPEEVQAWDTRAQRDSAVESLKAFGESAAAGAFDAVTGIPRLITAAAHYTGAIEDDPLAGVSGRQLLSNVATLGGDLGYEERARGRAQDHGTASALGGVAGAIGGGLGISSLAGRAGAAVRGATGSQALGTGAAGALEGAALSVQQTSEEAFLEDSELTAERMLAGMGWGALIGGGVGLAIGKGQQVLFGRAGSRGATPLDSPRTAPGPRSDAALEAAATRALGDVPPAPGLGGKLREALEDAQAAVAGVDRQALRDVGATRGFLDPASSGYKGRSLWWNREKIWGESTEQLTRKLEQAAGDADDVLDEVVDAGLKRANIAPKLTGDKAVMVTRAAEELQRVREEIAAALGRSDDFGNTALLNRKLRYLDAIDPARVGGADDVVSRIRSEGLESGQYLRDGMRDLEPFRGAYAGADAAEAELIATGKAAARNTGKRFEPVTVSVFDDGTGQFHLTDGRHRLTAAREAGAQNVAARVQRFDSAGKLVSETDEILPIGPGTPGPKYDPADAFIALDRTERALQKDVKALRSAATRQGDAFSQMQSRQLADYLESVQERVRSGLEDSAVWGEAADAQKAINARWGDYLRTQQTFRETFLRKVEGSDYATGRPVYRVDPDKVAAYIRKTGRQDGALVDEYFRRHIDARQKLTEAVSESFDLGEKAAKVQRIREGTEGIRSTLVHLDETARAVNQVEAIMEAESGSGAAGLGAVLGGVLGGAPGAAIGGALGAVSRPGTMIRQAAAIEQLARNVSKKIDTGIGDFFARHASPLRSLASRSKAAAPPGTRALPTVTALELFRGKEQDNQKAYRKRAGEILAVTAEYGSGIRARTAEALGGLPAKAPKLAAAMTVTATKGAEFLKSKLPSGTVNTRSLTPNSAPVTVSDLEIAQFAKYWSAVANPLSVLDDLRRGTVSPEQVEALRAVYPKLYQQVQHSVRTKLLELDQQGTLVPYQARLQLDLLLGLDGGGEYTASADFMVRFADMQAGAPGAGQEQRPQPPARPVNIASRLRTGTDALDHSKEM